MEEHEVQQLIGDFKDTFGSDRGKRILAWLSKRCFENIPTYVDANSLGTAYQEGARGVMIDIRAMLAKDSRKQPQEVAQTEEE